MIPNSNMWSNSWQAILRRAGPNRWAQANTGGLLSRCDVLHCVSVVLVKCMVVRESGTLRAGCDKWLEDGEIW